MHFLSLWCKKLKTCKFAGVGVKHRASRPGEGGGASTHVYVITILICLGLTSLLSIQSYFQRVSNRPFDGFFGQGD